jgi:hypothetical protein
MTPVRRCSLIAGLLVPFVLESACLIASRSFSVRPYSDDKTLWISAACGAFCLAPALRWWTPLAMAVYVPAMHQVLFAYGLAFVGVVYSLSL